MAQLNWTYYSLSGIPYTIDMYHGEESGHVMLFINSNIILIDFKIKKSKDYSFYIENQLIEFKINKENNAFDYKVIPKLPVPTEDQKEKFVSAHFWLPLILFIIVVNLILLLFYQL